MERHTARDRSLRAAVVGLGWWGRQIVDSLEASKLVSVVAAVDPRTDDCRPFAESHSIPLRHGLDDVLSDPAVDAVIVATPHGLHEEQVIISAGAGKHVFCEKPLALTPAAARRMVRACKEHRVTLGVGHERRFEGALEEIRRMVVEGDLGSILHLECNWSHNLFAQSVVSGWRLDPEQAPGGTLTALGVHITDFFQSIAGPVSEVNALSAHRSEDFPHDDVISVQFRFRSGATGLMCNLATTPFYGRISVFGDRGWVETRENSNVDVPEPATLTWRGLDDEQHTRTFPYSDTVRANIEQWARAAMGLGDYRFTEVQLIHNVEILEAIVLSINERSTVTLESHDPD